MKQKEMKRKCKHEDWEITDSMVEIIMCDDNCTKETNFVRCIECGRDGEYTKTNHICEQTIVWRDD